MTAPRPIRQMRLCAYGNCTTRFNAPHGQPHPAAYCSAECHRLAKQQAAKPAKPRTRSKAARPEPMRTTMLCFCGCGERAVQQHHAIYVQDLRRFAITRHETIRELVRDQRNLVPVAHRCHGNHHSASQRYRLVILPDSVFEFAAEVLGPGKALNYLRRRYDGEDVRLDALAVESDRRAA